VEAAMKRQTMRRKTFVTAVVLVIMATPLFGAQSGSPAQPAQKTAAAAEKDKKPAQPAPAAKPAPANPYAPAAATSKPAAVKTATAAPKAPSVRLAAASSPAPAKAVKASAVPLTPVQEKLQQNKELVKELQTKLPGADVVSVADGFKDLPQFVAAAHASSNLAIPFASLKGKLLSGNRTSLRQAIQELRPAASAAIEAQRAQYDATGMIRASEQAAAEAAQSSAKPKPAGAAPKGKQ
jgi:hypothetical protein